MYTRSVSPSISSDFFKGKVIILTGARQVGKTTLVKSIIGKFQETIVFNADNPTDRQKLENQGLESLTRTIGRNKIIFIDEAQKITSIGNTLKLLVDYYRDKKQIIATGSSALNLISNTQEPLTGRKFVYELFGLSLSEVFPSEEIFDIEKSLPNLLIYGSYPKVFLAKGDDKRRYLQEIATSYLYQDILELEDVRNPSAINRLVTALALQIGSEVSLTELGNMLKMDSKTVERYIDLLEKSYVVFRLPPYFSNHRKSLSKLNKIYFYDLGIRNALINNLNPIELRNDLGALWENFLIIERMKYRSYNNIYSSQYFWRTYDGAEVDLVEDRDGKLFGFEFKWGDKIASAPKSWLQYPNSKFSSINKINFTDFISFKN